MNNFTVVFRLDEIMNEKKVTVRKLGTLSGVGTATITRMMNNRTRAVSLDVISKLCIVLDIEPGELFKISRDQQEE
jgi:putative transcriptional regulator